MRALSKEERDLARKIRLCARHRELGKLHYSKSDELLEELLVEVDVSKTFRLNNRRKIARIKDNFATQNTCFRAHGIKRYELEISELAPKGKA